MISKALEEFMDVRYTAKRPNGRRGYESWDISATVLKGNSIMQYRKKVKLIMSSLLIFLSLKAFLLSTSFPSSINLITKPSYKHRVSE